MGEHGNVILVGAGPGDPGLLTLRGRQALETADVVLFDRLVGEEILRMMPQAAEKVDVGKSSGHHLIPQEEINALILRYAREGKRVVRLKGGDPYLFGRGAEELEAVVQEGIPFEVVPGVTSAIAVPAYGGIPVSHREMASSVHIITGHPRHGAEPSIQYDSLVRLGGTLVFLMGVGALKALTGGLMDAGMDPGTPAALVENGTRAGQRRLIATVSTIAEKAKAEGFRPPSVFIVGEVCNQSEDLNWFARRPLHGARVLVTRPRASAGTLVSLLRERGATVLEYPCIRTEPLPIAPELLDRLAEYGWIVFTSPVGAECFFSALLDAERDIRALGGAKLAAVGPKTAMALRSRGLIPGLVPESYHGKALAKELCARAEDGERILLFRAQEGALELPTALRESGFIVDDIAAYKTLYECPESAAVRQELEAGRIDYVTFTSASTVHGFARSQEGLDYTGVTGICIGEETAAAAREYGIQVQISDQATVESLVDCTERMFTAKPRE